MTGGGQGCGRGIGLIRMEHVSPVQPWRRITARLWHAPDSHSASGSFCQRVHTFVLNQDEYQGTDWTDMFPTARCETPATRIGKLSLGMRPLGPIGTHRKPGVVCGMVEVGSGADRGGGGRVAK